MQRRQKATNDADAAAAAAGGGREGGTLPRPLKPRPGPAPKITHNLWPLPLRVRRSHLASCNAKRCAGKIYGASSAAAGARGEFMLKLLV